MSLLELFKELLAILCCYSVPQPRPEQDINFEEIEVSDQNDVRCYDEDEDLTCQEVYKSNECEVKDPIFSSKFEKIDLEVQVYEIGFHLIDEIIMQEECPCRLDGGRDSPQSNSSIFLW